MPTRSRPTICWPPQAPSAPWFASVTFGGTDLKTCYIGSLRGTRIPCFESPVAGLPMVH